MKSSINLTHPEIKLSVMHNKPVLVSSKVSNKISEGKLQFSYSKIDNSVPKSVIFGGTA